MGKIKGLIDAYKACSTEEKIAFWLDIVCGAGAGVLSVYAGNKATQDMNPVEKVLAKVTIFGLGVAGGSVASNALNEEYGKPVAHAIEKAKARAAEERMKEEIDNGGDQ